MRDDVQAHTGASRPQDITAELFVVLNTELPPPRRSRSLTRAASGAEARDGGTSSRADSQKGPPATFFRKKDCAALIQTKIQFAE